MIVSAGYNYEGNDMNGHVHEHSLGNFLTMGVSPQRRGFFCAAPLVNGMCSDPSEKVADAVNFSLSYVFCHSIKNFDYLVTFVQGMIIGAYTEDRNLFNGKMADEVSVEDCKNIVRSLIQDIQAFGFEK